MYVRALVGWELGRGLSVGPVIVVLAGIALRSSANNMNNIKSVCTRCFNECWVTGTAHCLSCNAADFWSRTGNGQHRVATLLTNPPFARTAPRPSLANGFNFFNPNFWSFGRQSIVPVSAPTKPPHPHPPKKFTHSPVSNSKEEKLNYRKQQKTTSKPRRPVQSTTTTTTTSSTTTTSRPISTDGPFRIALPTLTFPSSGAAGGVSNDKEKDKRAAANLRHRFNCPRENEVRFQLFPKICKTDKDCAVWQRDEICCDIFGSSSCVAGVPKPLEETAHAR